MYPSYIALSSYIICTLDHACEKIPVILLQYLFKDDEHEFRCLNPHGNSKRKVPYRRTFPSTIDKWSYQEKVVNVQNTFWMKFTVRYVMFHMWEVLVRFLVDPKICKMQDGQFHMKRLVVLKTRWWNLIAFGCCLNGHVERKKTRSRRNLFVNVAYIQIF